MRRTQSSGGEGCNNDDNDDDDDDDDIDDDLEICRPVNRAVFGQVARASTRSVSVNSQT